MNQPSTKNIAVLLLILTAAVVLLSFMWTSYDPSAQKVEDRTPAPGWKVIEATHEFTDGVHRVYGKTDLPTPCHSLTVDALIAESYPEQVTLQFASAGEAETCIQVISEQEFSIEFSASSEASIRATWNGAPITLSLVPVL